MSLPFCYFWHGNPAALDGFCSCIPREGAKAVVVDRLLETPHARVLSGSECWAGVASAHAHASAHASASSPRAFGESNRPLSRIRVNGHDGRLSNRLWPDAVSSASDPSVGPEAGSRECPPVQIGRVSISQSTNQTTMTLESPSSQSPYKNAAT